MSIPGVYTLRWVGPAAAAAGLVGSEGAEDLHKAVQLRHGGHCKKRGAGEEPSTRRPLAPLPFFKSSSELFRHFYKQARWLALNWTKWTEGFQTNMHLQIGKKVWQFMRWMLPKMRCAFLCQPITSMYLPYRILSLFPSHFSCCFFVYSLAVGLNPAKCTGFNPP